MKILKNLRIQLFDDLSIEPFFILSYSSQHFDLDPNVHDGHEAEEGALRKDFNLMLTRWRGVLISGFDLGQSDLRIK